MVVMVLLLLRLGLLECARKNALLFLLEETSAFIFVVDLLSLELLELWSEGLLGDGRGDVKEAKHFENVDVDVAE